MTAIPVVRLGELITPAKTIRAGDRRLPILSMTMHGGLVDQADKFKKRIASRETDAYLVVKRHQLVVGFPIDEGVLSFQEQYEEAIVSPAYAIWDVRQPDAVDRAYLERFLRSPQALSYYEAKLRSTTARRRSLPRDTFLSMPIPLPSLPEQRRIAAILDKADAVRRKRRQTLDLADQFLRSAFLDMFGEPVTNPKGWPRKALGELCSIRRGGSPRPIHEYLGGTIPWVKISDATGGDDTYIDSTAEFIKPEGVRKSLLLEPGSLILANSGVSLGFARILRIRGCVHDGWLALSDIGSHLDPVFLLKMLNSATDHLRRTAPSGTQPNLNIAILEAFPVLVPPRSMQDAFRRIVEHHSGFRQRVTKLTCAHGELCSSMVQRACLGDL